ncbi:hypothetical protein [Pseudomonas sp. 43NM1]|uniref:hypothetical protein n=1 Tax=Pseudomonas sp. 43NM1 TaxID=1904755 RepID=UPI0012FEA00F
MRNFAAQSRGRLSRDASSFAHAPQKRGAHCLANPFGVRFFVNDPQMFGINPQKKLCNTLPGKPCLNVDYDAITHYFTVRSVMQLTVGPQPKSRSAMWHLPAPLPGEPTDFQRGLFKYVHGSEESIHSYKRYRCNVLARPPTGSKTLKVQGVILG